MARFYFDRTEAGEAFVDEDGLDFADVDEARRMALRGLGEIAKDELHAPGPDEREFAITVRDHARKALLTANLFLRVVKMS